jgi:hypothetical protein
MPQTEKEKNALSVEDNATNVTMVGDQSDDALQLRRTLMKRLAVSGFLAPAVLVTLLKKPAAASP